MRLARLRNEVAALETELGETAPPPATPPRGGWWRTVVVVVAVTLLAIVAPLTVVATWAHDQVSDTDRYVATVAPLASDPAIQKAVSERITAEIVSRIDVRAITTEAADALAERGVPENVAASLRALGTPLAQGVQNFIADKVAQLVASDEFAAAWEEANRQAHTQMVAILTGDNSSAVQVEGNAVQINLATVISAVKARLIDAGFALAERIPDVTAQFTIFESADIAKVQSGFRLLSAVAHGLPVLAVLLLATALVAARRRRRTLVVASLVLAGSMLALGLLLNTFRIVYLDAVPSDRLPTDAAAAIYDQLVGFIRLNLRAVLVLALTVAAVAWVTGPEPGPMRVRKATGGVLEGFRTRRDSAGFRTGPVGEFLGRYRTAIRGLVAGAVVLIYVLADHPTGSWTLKLVLVGGLVLLVVELLARTPQPTEPAGAEVQ